MIFDPHKVNHARDAIKSLAALGYELELTPYQLDTLDEMLKTWAEQEQLVNEHLRRVAA
jgi:hypothetical protein